MDSGYAGVEHVGGDMFVSVPKADAIFMKVSFACKYDAWLIEKL